MMPMMDAILFAFFQRGSFDMHHPMNHAGLSITFTASKLFLIWTYIKQKPTMKQIMPKSSDGVYD
jgi:hypothetical protein